MTTEPTNDDDEIRYISKPVRQCGSICCDHMGEYHIMLNRAVPKTVDKDQYSVVEGYYCTTHMADQLVSLADQFREGMGLTSRRNNQ